MGKEHFDFFYECYLDTTGRKWGSTYLKKEFFLNILKSFKDKILLIVAFQDNQKIASALNFLSKTHLYGRLWGSKYEVPYLHFELCYYQAIDFAIENNINFVEEPEKIVAAIKFKGWANDKKIERYKKQLKTALKSESIPHLNKFELHGYNAPYEVFNRRNEIIVELKQKF